MRIRKRYLAGGTVLVLAIAWLLYLSFGSAASYYFTVSEFSAREIDIYDTDVRVAGVIADVPVEWDAGKVELTFAITEGGETMTVMYGGARPSNFEPGSGILVEGQYHTDEVFHATRLILKCPSKYEIEE